jgi:hypothetical protein
VFSDIDLLLCSDLLTATLDLSLHLYLIRVFSTSLLLSLIDLHAMCLLSLIEFKI